MPKAYGLRQRSKPFFDEENRQGIIVDWTGFLTTETQRHGEGMARAWTTISFLTSLISRHYKSRVVSKRVAHVLKGNGRTRVSLRLVFPWSEMRSVAVSLG
jgi:hypothetical protein